MSEMYFLHLIASQFKLTTFQVLNSPMWLMTALLESVKEWKRIDEAKVQNSGCNHFKRRLRKRRS